MFVSMSGYSLWNPVIWLVVFVIMMVVVYLFRGRGQEQYKRGTEQTRVFLSGEEVPGPEQVNIRAHNIYWGFFETLKKYYQVLVEPHTGIINDYVIWLVLVTALGAVTLFLAG